MSVMALSDLKSRPSILFPKGNSIIFWMDFCCWSGIPSDRVFYIIKEVPEHQSLCLAARGFGVRDDYGNGSIMVKKHDLIAELVTSVESAAPAYGTKP